MQRLVAAGVSEVVLAQEAVLMGAKELILVAVVADVATNDRQLRARKKFDKILQGCKILV